MSDGEDLLQVGRLGGVALEVLGLGEGELHVLGQGAGEVVAAERDGPLPDDAAAVGDDEVAAVGADVEGDDAVLLGGFARFGRAACPCRAGRRTTKLHRASGAICTTWTSTPTSLKCCR